jgi:hypothetical protein
MHDQLRSISLLSVLGVCGVQSEWKTRKGGTEWTGACPIHGSKNNRKLLQLRRRRTVALLSCGAKGSRRRKPGVRVKRGRGRVVSGRRGGESEKGKSRRHIR